MKKIILAILFLCANTSGWATQFSGPKELSQEQCKEMCISQECKTIAVKQQCLNNCQNKIDLQPCLNTPASPKTLSDANTAAGIKKDMFTKKLLEAAPDAVYYLNAGNLKLRDAKAAPRARDYSSVNYVLTNLRGMCAQTINEYLNVTKGKDIKTKEQFIHVIKSIDQIINQIKTPKKDADGTLVGTNMMLKRSVGDAELLIKNCIQQGATATFSFKNQSSQKVKGFFNKLKAPFSCSACTSDKCTKSLDIYKKCMENCPKKYTAQCQIKSNDKIRDEYQKYNNNLNF